MKIKIRLTGPLRKYIDHENSKIIELSEGASVKDALEILCVPDNKFMIAINGVRKGKEDRLSAGDEVVVFPVVTGG